MADATVRVDIGKCPLSVHVRFASESRHGRTQTWPDTVVASAKCQKMG